MVAWQDWLHARHMACHWAAALPYQLHSILRFRTKHIDGGQAEAEPSRLAKSNCCCLRGQQAITAKEAVSSTAASPLEPTSACYGPAGFPLRSHLQLLQGHAVLLPLTPWRAL